jgi:hypothetical protein
LGGALATQCNRRYATGDLYRLQLPALKRRAIRN